MQQKQHLNDTFNFFCSLSKKYKTHPTSLEKAQYLNDPFNFFCRSNIIWSTHPHFMQLEQHLNDWFKKFTGGAIFKRLIQLFCSRSNDKKQRICRPTLWFHQCISQLLSPEDRKSDKLIKDTQVSVCLMFDHSVSSTHHASILRGTSL